MRSLRIAKILGAALLLAGLTGHCMFPLASKQFLAFNPEGKGTRIKHEKQGTALILSVIPLGDSLDLKAELEIFKKNYLCVNVENIDVQYFNHSFFLVSWDRMLIRADCVRAEGTPKAAGTP